MDQPAKVSGEIRTITYRNDQNGWTVLRFTPDDSSEIQTATGHINSVGIGDHVTLTGSWTHHKSYGRQFTFSDASSEVPTTLGGLKRYLSSGRIRGLGEKTAELIVEFFGQDTYRVLTQTPYRLRELTGIGKKRLDAIITSWEQHQEHRDTEIFLTSHGITPGQSAKIIQAYGHRTTEVVSQNPYRLAFEIRGIGFLTADKIGASLGIDRKSPERLKAAIIYLLEKSSEAGHCFLEKSDLEKDLHRLLEVEEIEFPMLEALETLDRCNYIENVEGPEGEIIYLADLFFHEKNIANLITQLASSAVTIDQQRASDWIHTYSNKLGMQLNEQQFAAVQAAAQHKVLILTGGPGVGKTTTANAIIRLLKAVGHDVVLAAPTGRAAKRLTEVAAVEAKTIHRLLEWNPQVGGFQRDQTNPLPASAVVIDETSMIDIPLASALLQAIRQGSHLVFIGDADQLPSVGPGSLLRDLIESQMVHTIKLTQIFRQKATSGIIHVSHAINSGEFVEIDSELTSECCFIECKSVEGIHNHIKNLVTHQLPNLGVDPRSDLQLLSPMKRGELGTYSLNQLLQEQLNPATSNKRQMSRDSFALREGDKVIQLNNCYDLGVFNGDIGYVHHAGVNDGKLVIDYGERLVSYPQEKISDLQLAYAITIHKSQGSEFPIVIIPITMQHFIMLQRNLYYTGLTRAKSKAIFIGDKQALRMAISNNRNTHRKSQLKSLLNHQGKK